MNNKSTVTLLIGGKVYAKQTSHKNMTQMIQTSPNELMVQFGKGKASRWYSYTAKDLRPKLDSLIYGDSLGKAFSTNFRNSADVVTKELTGKKLAEIMKRYG